MKRKTRLASLICVILLIAAALYGCSSSTSSADRSAAAGSSYSKGGNISYPSEMGLNDYDYETAPSAAPQAAGDSGVPSADEMSQKLIYTVDMSIETTNYETSLQTVDELTKTYGGYVEGSSVGNNRISTGEAGMRRASYTLRIPSNSLDAFLSSCGSVGNVYDSSKRTQNATQQYIDSSARKESLKTEEQTLLNLLAQANNLEAVIALNQRLSEVRYEIESIEATLRNIDALASYSTVNISLYEVMRETKDTVIPKTFWERVGARMNNTLETFLDRMSALGVFLLGELPLKLVMVIAYLLPFAVLALIVLFIYRAVRRRQEKKNARVRAAAVQPEQQQEEREDVE